MNIVVVGARSLLRAGLISLLSRLGFESIEEALDVKHVIASVRTQPFAKLIIYLLGDSENAISPAKEIRDWDPTAKIVFVGQDLDLEIMSACFAAGASGYLLRTISGDALRESILLVESGEKVFPSELVSKFPVLSSKLINQDPNNSEGSRSGFSHRSTRYSAA
jgi:two-component system nitrate/nitrite response regulator NarL